MPLEAGFGTEPVRYGVRPSSPQLDAQVSYGRPGWGSAPPGPSPPGPMQRPGLPGRYNGDITG